MHRPLAAAVLGAALLLAGCTDDKPAASRPSPDDASRRGCNAMAYQLTREKPLFWAGNTGGAFVRAAGSTDTDVRAAARELIEAAEEAGEFYVTSHGEADMTQAEARIAAAQQKMMTACRELLGEPPWS
ncbi:hypothetical protein ABGB16_13110 [Micromonospora sp. B11E3]|uniref:hypothetical protein n=1 Tax=Micromonospora sp. B11E3 TaxID=3153562 RepID=UPI00325C64FD